MARIPPQVRMQPIPQDTMDWAAGIVDPFSAQDIKVPDMFSYPTITASSKGIHVVAADLNGNIQLVVAPYPTLSIIAVAGAMTTTGMYQYPSKPVFAATSTENLNALFANYRVVSVGIRVKNLIAPLSATGRVIIAPYISAGAIPGHNFIKNNVIDGGYLAQAVTANASNNMNLLSLPFAKEYSIQELISGTAHWSTRPTTTECYNLHSPAGQNASATTFYGHSVGGVYNSSVGPVGATDTIDSNLPNNYTGCIVYATGLPPSQAALQFEYIYHYEGTPAMSTMAGTITPAAAENSPVDSSGMSSMLRKIAQNDHINLFAETVLGGAGKMAMKFLKSL